MRILNEWPPSGQSLGYNTFKTAIPKLNPPIPFVLILYIPVGGRCPGPLFTALSLGTSRHSRAFWPRGRGPPNIYECFLHSCFCFERNSNFELLEYDCGPRGAQQLKNFSRNGAHSLNKAQTLAFYTFSEYFLPAWHRGPRCRTKLRSTPLLEKPIEELAWKQQNFPEERQQGPAHGPEAPVAHPMAQEGTQNQQPAAPAPADAVEPRGRAAGSF